MMMHKQSRKTQEKTTSLVDERIQEFSVQLDNFFKTDNQSSEILKALFEQYYPSFGISESIIYVYSNSLSKPTINRLLDKTIEFLHLNNNENPYYLGHIQINEQLESCLLHNAIETNYENIFQLLLKSDFNPNSLLSDHETPLLTAVVCNQIDPIKRLEYIQQLIAHGADPLIQDVNKVSPFQRLCGQPSNYPIVYTFLRDYLIFKHPDQVQIELNSGLTNAVYNWCVPIVTDLLEHGAIYNELKKVDSFTYFLSRIASSILKGRRSISHVDRFILCLIQIFLHNNPCENYSICIEIFFKVIYIPAVCFEFNNDPLNKPSLINLKKFLYLSFHYGYLTKREAHEIRTTHLPVILTTPIRNPLINLTIRQTLFDILSQYIDELIIKYQQNPLSLKLLSIRRIRQSMIKVNQKNIQQLNILETLKILILPPQ